MLTSSSIRQDHLNTLKEEFSRAYIRAIATTAGYLVEEPRKDVGSVDVRIYPVDRDFPELKIQLKCSAGLKLQDVISYPLDVDNYNHLRDTRTKKILVVVAVPTEISEWLTNDDELLAMRRCGYWCCLQNRGATTNTSTITIDIPRSQIFTAAVLTSLMQKIDDEEPLC